MERLIDRSAAGGTLLQHVNVQPIMPVDQRAPDGTTMEQYLLQGNPYEPFRNTEENLDAKCFPHLFPSGRFGFDAPRPTRKATKRKVVRSRLRNADRRWAADTNYLTTCAGLLQQLDIMSLLGVQARMSHNSLTMAEVQRLLKEGDSKMEQSMSTIFAKLRGFAPYWQDVKNNLRTHLTMFGAPTWFVTLNPALERWGELHRLYEAVHHQHVEPKHIMEWVARDPVLVSRWFHQRFRSFFINVVLAKGGHFVLSLIVTFYYVHLDGPLGNIIHYFWRVEYQQRGTPHVHMMLWEKDAPKMEDGEACVVDFIDAHVTARMPDPVAESELYELVSTT